jgi:hypothetical protein
MRKETCQIHFFGVEITRFCVVGDESLGNWDLGKTHVGTLQTTCPLLIATKTTI